MKAEKLIIQLEGEMPVIAALPFSISINENEMPKKGIYNPKTQLTTHFGRGYSTCQYDDSAGGIFETKRDTQKDD